MKATSTDIKNSFGKYLRLCTTEPVYITKNGEVIAKLVNHFENPCFVKDASLNTEVYAREIETYESYDSERVNEAISKYNKNRIQMTYDEFTKMNKEAGNRYEYIFGEVYLLASPTVFHQRIVSRLHIEISRYLDGKPCDVFVSPFDGDILPPLVEVGASRSSSL
ncbi:MAG TPA: Uma2 family endonuclease, partial [Clostridia bacterium]|nr:Uma2 family endonuclease [Clostridia bacterium]